MSGESLGNARRKLHPEAGSRPPLGAVQRASRLRGQAGVPVSGHPESEAQNAKAGISGCGEGCGGGWTVKKSTVRKDTCCRLPRAPRRRPGDPDLRADTHGQTVPVCGAGCPGATSCPPTLHPCPPQRTPLARSHRWTPAAGGSASPRGAPAEAASGGPGGTRAAPEAL